VSPNQTKTFVHGVWAGIHRMEFMLLVEVWSFKLLVFLIDIFGGMYSIFL